jgi:glycine cleavage system aminomethyltransferase T
LARYAILAVRLITLAKQHCSVSPTLVPTQRLSGVRFGGGKAPPCGKPFPLTTLDGEEVGQITSGIFSPRFDCNIGLSMIPKPLWQVGTPVVVHTPDGYSRRGLVSNLPF